MRRILSGLALASLALLGAKQGTYPTPGPGRNAYSAPPTCTPPTMNIARWLPANSGYGSMTDVVGGNNATQSTGADQPTYSGSVSAYGGKPGVVFNGSSDFLSIATPITVGGPYLSGYAVFLAGNTNQVIFGNVPGSGGQTAIYMISRANKMEQNIYGGGGLSGSTSINPGSIYAVGFQYNTSTLQLDYFICSGGSCTSDGSFTLGGATINLPINAIGDDGSASLFNATLGEAALANTTLDTTTLGTYIHCQYPPI